MYTQYCSNQGRALAEIENLKKTNPQFSTFLEARPPLASHLLSLFPEADRRPTPLWWLAPTTTATTTTTGMQKERALSQARHRQLHHQTHSAYLQVPVALEGSFTALSLLALSSYAPFLTTPRGEQEIVQHTPKDHFDYENLLAAVAKMTEVVTDVNENKRKVENVQKLLEIQNAIVSDTGVVGVPLPPSPLTSPSTTTACPGPATNSWPLLEFAARALLQTLKLVEPGRKFVQEGMLVDLRAGKEMERKYFLFNNILILARPMLKGKNQAGVVYKLKDEIALKQTFIRDNECMSAHFVEHACCVCRVCCVSLCAVLT